MAYSEKVVDHYENPRNVGSFDKGDETVGTGMVGAPACGDVMKLQIKVNPQTGVIEDARFKTYGCGSAIASSSLVTEWVKGKTLDQAAALKNSQIAEELALAAGQDPLLDPGRRRDQGRRRRLQKEAFALIRHGCHVV
jgi:nitrogen fixation NifU-like protein